jgi:hypothetical protein
MRTRLRLGCITILILTVAACPLILLYGPQVYYAITARISLDAARAKWQAAAHTEYTAVVANNSLTDPTGGMNTIHVKDGLIIEASNPNCPDCATQAFAALTVDALFGRIAQQCLDKFPDEFCNVHYHPSFGYPVRLDSYPYHLAGIERPSITVQRLEFSTNQ